MKIAQPIKIRGPCKDMIPHFWKIMGQQKATELRMFPNKNDDKY